MGMNYEEVDGSQSGKVGGKVRKQDNSEECGEGEGEILGGGRASEVEEELSECGRKRRRGNAERE